MFLFLLSISAVFIKEEVHCDKFATQIEPGMNGITGDCAGFGLNVVREAQTNQPNNIEEEMVIKEEPLENGLVSYYRPIIMSKMCVSNIGNIIDTHI